MREEIDHLKTALQNKRSELVRAIRSQSTQLIVSEIEHDALDRTQSIHGREETVMFLNTLTRTLTGVDEALMAMDEGSYGTCLECGESIALRRLHAIPWASHCIRCQQAHDHSRQLRVGASGWDEAA
jgi:DnaK suppressor protein